MDNTQIRLRWTSHQGTILSIFDALLTSEALVDVTLAAEGQYIRAHKVILSACSPYFQELLGLDSSKHPILFMKDVKYAELKALVQYMYRGEVNIPQDDLQNLLSVAQSLKIRGLADVETNASSGTTTNLSSDTLVFPNLSKPIPKPPAMTPGTTTTSTNLHNISIQQTQVSAPTPVPKVKVQITPTGPGPASQRAGVLGKRARVETPVSIPRIVSSQSVVTPQAPVPLENIGAVDQDPLGGANEEQNFIVADQSFSIPPVDNEIQVEEGVKIEVDEAVITVEDDDDMGEEHDEENSMSHSSFNEGWNDNLSHLMTDDGEVPGTSRGTGSGSGTNDTEGTTRPTCEKCGKVYSSSKSLWRHKTNSECSDKKTSYPCIICLKVFTRPDNLRRHFVVSHSSSTGF